MATLVLTAVGSVLGGPVGAAIGGLIGQTVDREVLFAPKGRQGPRLTELKLQTSSYGTPIPLQFGTMRVAGSVIWATDLIESRSKSSAGKGQPKVTSYSYAASFAVALSGRAVLGVGRIWADGKLLRGAAGDLKSELGGFRLHPGGEDQAVDPLIASAEGVALTPAIAGWQRTTRLGLPLLGTGQAQKEVTHNEALTALDLVVQASVVAVGRNDPPDAPVLGEGWIVGEAPSGAWGGQAGAIAGWTAGGWRFVAAVEGMAAWSVADALVVRYTGGGWVKGAVRASALIVGGEQVVGPRRAAIAAPSGGAMVDAEARAAVQAMLDCLRVHGLIAS